MTEDNTVTVSEDKFNGTSTLIVQGAPSADHARGFARQFWRDEYGHTPSKVVVEKSKLHFNKNVWNVMVADHSSGSLKSNREYEYTESKHDE